MLSTARKILKLCFVFYTFWGLILHGLYFIGLIPNTRIVAVFVFLSSQFLLLIYPGYFSPDTLSVKRFLYEFCFHWLPIVIVPFNIEEGWIVLGISLLVYVALHGFSSVKKYYITQNQETMDSILT